MALNNSPIFQVDYNDRNRRGHLLASLRFATPPRAEVGEYVLTIDDEGNECWGTIVHVNGQSVHIDLDRATWNRALRVDSIFAAPEPRGSSALTAVCGPEVELV